MKYDSINQYTSSLNIAFKSLNESYEAIGEMLYEINQDKLYKPEYKSFVKYCEEEFSLSRTKCYSFIKIYKLLRDKPEFKECSYSVLQEISSMNEEEINEVSADMSVKEIRELKKELKGTSKKSKPKKDEDKVIEAIKENEKLKQENLKLKEENKKLREDKDFIANQLHQYIEKKQA